MIFGVLKSNEKMIGPASVLKHSFFSTIRQLALCGLFACGLTQIAWAQPNITKVQVLPIHPGMNVIHGFMPDGRDGAILQAWRDNGNAHGYTKFVVMVPAKGANGKDWSIVGFETSARGLEDSINGVPHTGEDNVRSVRFARGEIDGAKSSLLVIADRDLGQGRSYYDPAPTRISIYKLVDVSADGAGSTPLVFRLVRATPAKSLFCNSDLALNKELGIPLPAEYGGPNKIDGCFSQPSAKR